MDRRTFIKQCAFATSAFAIPGSSGFLSKVACASALPETFSLSLISDNPEKAVGALEMFVKDSALKSPTIKVSETPLTGTQNADLVFVKNNHLINFRSRRDEMSNYLLQLTREFSLPKIVQNPVLIRFASEDVNAKPNKIIIYHKEILITETSLNENGEHKIEGSRGGLTLRIEEKSAYLIDADCKHKTCVKMGKINQSGQNLVCVPNEIRIAVAGKHESGIDALAL